MQILDHCLNYCNVMAGPPARADDQSLSLKLQDLKKMLASKSSFEAAIATLQTLCEHEFSDSISSDLKKEWLKIFQRCFTLLRTRYTVHSFWRGGYNLFLSAKVGYFAQVLWCQPGPVAVPMPESSTGNRSRFFSFLAGKHDRSIDC